MGGLEGSDGDDGSTGTRLACVCRGDGIARGDMCDNGVWDKQDGRMVCHVIGYKAKYWCSSTARSSFRETGFAVFAHKMCRRTISEWE